MLFVLTKTKQGDVLTKDRLAKVIALWFQDAVGQKFGWLKERAKKGKEERKVVNRRICWWICSIKVIWICMKVLWDERSGD